MLGNIYSEMNNPQDAYSYYKKALDSLDENVEQSTLSELYFKFALANDDKGDIQQALNYYTKCIGLVADNNYRSLAYSNLASCYLDNENYDDALSCFSKAYEIDHNNNSYEGIYYNASNLAKLYKRTNPKKCLEFLIEAKKCAEFLNEPFYIIESTIELGDFYYNNSETLDKSLIEYIKAKKLSNQVGSTLNVSKIESRINDMRLRLGKQKYDEIERKYDK
jgi:tetratricopeptide (TPR) repeat protein